MPKYHGIALVSIDGDIMQSNEASLDPGGYKRETIFANGVAVGFKDEPVASVCEMKMPYKAGMDLTELSNLTDAVVNFVSDTGDEYVIPLAWVVEPAKLDNDGTVPLKLEGQPAIKK